MISQKKFELSRPADSISLYFVWQAIVEAVRVYGGPFFSFILMFVCLQNISRSQRLPHLIPGINMYNHRMPV